MKGFYENFLALSVKKLKKVLMIFPHWPWTSVSSRIQSLFISLGTCSHKVPKAGGTYGIPKKTLVSFTCLTLTLTLSQTVHSFLLFCSAQPLNILIADDQPFWIYALITYHFHDVCGPRAWESSLSSVVNTNLQLSCPSLVKSI